MPKAGNHQTPWLLEPYIPREGVIFLYGKKGVGKSPLTWSLARSIASGEPWMGLPVSSPGEVLYIEVDSPLSVVKARTDHLKFPPNLFFYFPTNSFLCSQDGYDQMKKETGHLHPSLVIVNTLRKVHLFKDKEPETPAKVYTLFRKLFQSVLFVHHEKKTPADPEQGYERGEEFSGSLAWANDAQVCLQLRRAPRSKDDGSHNLILVNTGNQLHAQPPDLKLLLDADGYTLTPR